MTCSCAVGEGDIVTIDGAARETGLPIGTIRQKCHQKTIPFLKVGRSVRFSRKALRAWLSSFEVPVHGEVALSGRRAS